MSSGFDVTVNAPLPAFKIHEQAFTLWVDTLGEELEYELPSSDDEAPSARLSCLVYSAWVAGVILGANGMALDVHASDEMDGSGYHVMVRNHTRTVYLTNGWHELSFWYDEHPPVEQARSWLEEVITEANTTLLDAIQQTERNS